MSGQIKQITALVDSLGARRGSWLKVWNSLGWADVQIHGCGGLPFLEMDFPGRILNPPDPKPAARPEMFILQAFVNDALKNPGTIDACMAKLAQWCDALQAIPLDTVVILPPLYPSHEALMREWGERIDQVVAPYADVETLRLAFNPRQLPDGLHPTPWFSGWQAIMAAGHLGLAPRA